MRFVREHWRNNGRHNKISKKPSLTTYREQIRRIKPSRENRESLIAAGRDISYTAEEHTGRVKPT